MNTPELVKALETIRHEMYAVGQTGTRDRLDILIARLKAEPDVLAEGRGWQETDSVWVVDTNPEHLLGGPSRHVALIELPAKEE